MGKQRYGGGYELLTPNAGGLTFDDQYLDRVRLQEDQARAKKKRDDELKEYLSQYEDDPYSQAFAEVEFESKQEDAYKAKQQEQEDRIAAEYDDPYDKAFAVAEVRTWECCVT